MQVRWIPRAAQRTMPWKNGGGSTREVAREPAQRAGGPEFAWRVSVASVAGDGPFSSFPGVDRSLWLVRGNGMLLDVAGATVRLDRPLQRFDFAGETPIHARLIGGPNEDLNVMVDRATTRAVARIVELAAAGCWSAELPSGSHLVLVLAGGLQVGAGELAALDAWRGDGAGTVALGATAAGATALVASFVAAEAR
ncbi:MAG: HutD family protein [Planctomycetota bacterium]